MTPFVCNCINKYRTYLKYDESINTSIFVEAGQLCSVESTTICRRDGKVWLLYLFFAKSPSQVMPNLLGKGLLEETFQLSAAAA